MRRSFFSILVLVLLANPVHAAEGDNRKKYEDEELKIRIIPRGKENIVAFHQGRGFPPFAVEEIRKVCYVTVLMRNISQKKHWLELDNWRFTSTDPSFKRLNREFWKAKWNKLGLELSYQSTFGWYLLPERRDLHPDEPVGGSVVFSYSDKPFDMELRFRLGEKANEGEKIVKFSNVRCEAS